MDKQKLRRADICFSLLLMGLSAWIFTQSIKLFFNPFGRRFADVRPEDIKAGIEQWYKSPALVPAILAVLLFLCALMLMHHALKEGARLDFFTKKNLLALFHNREFYVVVVVVAALSCYIFGAMPLCRKHLNFFPKFQGFPFMVATFLYLLTMMVIFNRKKPRQMLLSLLISAAAAGAITYGFGIVAMIPLP